MRKKAVEAHFKVLFWLSLVEARKIRKKKKTQLQQAVLWSRFKLKITWICHCSANLFELTNYMENVTECFQLMQLSHICYVVVCYRLILNSWPWQTVPK